MEKAAREPLAERHVRLHSAGVVGARRVTTRVGWGGDRGVWGLSWVILAQPFTGAQYSSFCG